MLGFPRFSTIHRIVFNNAFPQIEADPLKLLKSCLMAASASCSLSLCCTGVVRSKPVHSVHPLKPGLPSRTPSGCHLSIPRVAQLQAASTSQEVESVSKVPSDDAVLRVFSDDAKGIVCYRSKTGEVVCEGLDEGPHFYPPSGSNVYMPDMQAAAILPVLGEGMYEI